MFHKEFSACQPYKSRKEWKVRSTRKFTHKMKQKRTEILVVLHYNWNPNMDPAFNSYWLGERREITVHQKTIQVKQITTYSSCSWQLFSQWWLLSHWCTNTLQSNGCHVKMCISLRDKKQIYTAKFKATDYKISDTYLEVQSSFFEGLLLH